MTRIYIVIFALFITACASKTTTETDEVVNQESNVEIAAADVPVEQQLDEDYEWCRTKAQTVDALSTFRDQGLTKESAFSALVSDRALPENLLVTISSLNDIAFGFSDLEPMAVATLTYSACMVDALGLLTDDAQGFLIIGAEECQAEFPGLPEEIHQCIDQISANIIDAASGG